MQTWEDLVHLHSNQRSFPYSLQAAIILFELTTFPPRFVLLFKQENYVRLIRMLVNRINYCKTCLCLVARLRMDLWSKRCSLAIGEQNVALHWVSCSKNWWQASKELVAQTNPLVDGGMTVESANRVQCNNQTCCSKSSEDAAFFCTTMILNDSEWIRCDWVDTQNVMVLYPFLLYRPLRWTLLRQQKRRRFRLLNTSLLPSVQSEATG